MNTILLLIIFLTFPMESQVISSRFYSLHLRIIIIPLSHPPSVFPSADYPPFIYLIHKPTHGAPTLHQFSFTNLVPNIPSHLSLGNPYMYTQPRLFFISLVIVKRLCFQHIHSFFVVILNGLLFPWKINPCRHPPFQ
jgi:hypothetical protein